MLAERLAGHLPRSNALPLGIPIMGFGSMTEEQREAIRETGALARLFVGLFVVLITSIIAWLVENWNPERLLVSIAITLVIASAFAAWIALETARASIAALWRE